MLDDRTLTDRLRENSNRPQEILIENDVRLSERQFAVQNLIDEKIVNNMLKLNILFYFFILLSIAIVLFYGKHIFGFSNEDVQLYFSFYDFTVESFNLSLFNVTNKYTCVKNTTSCENNCHNISLNELKIKFQIECYDFSKYFVAGEIVNFFNRK